MTMAKDEHQSDPVAAIEAQIAGLKNQSAALERRLVATEQRRGAQEQLLADLAELHAPALAELRAQRAAATPEAQAGRAAEEARDRERRDAIAYLKHAETKVRFPLGALREVVEIAGKAGKLLMPSDATPLRDILPLLEQAVARVRALIAQEPWPEAEERLQGRNQGETLLADARAVLAEFDHLLAEREAARSGAARR